MVIQHLHTTDHYLYQATQSTYLEMFQEQQISTHCSESTFHQSVGITVRYYTLTLSSSHLPLPSTSPLPLYLSSLPLSSPPLSLFPPLSPLPLPLYLPSPPLSYFEKSSFLNTINNESLTAALHCTNGYTHTIDSNTIIRHMTIT